MCLRATLRGGKPTQSVKIMEKDYNGKESIAKCSDSSRSCSNDVEDFIIFVDKKIMKTRNSSLYVF